MPRLLAVLLLLFIVLPAGGDSTNRLRNHPSPYLAMHGADPVHWQLWGREALQLAREENRLLFVSSGYFACHWCHVMQQESYRDPEVAALLNRHFVPVKIDRELHPALDAHLVEFVQRTRGSAGWPLNVFLTPEGFPLVGLTYASRHDFLEFLKRLEAVWGKGSDELKAMARQAAEAIDPPVSTAPLQEPRVLQQQLVTMALSLGDELEGGFGQQSRFPMAPQWGVLLGHLESGPNDGLRNLVALTLEQMMNRGLRDHLGGGFFRYTVDPGWRVPHYEKMLYTQALLARLYLKAAKLLGRPAFREVARETLEFSLRQLRGDEGGFISSLSAVDKHNVEGGGYLWTEQQLAEALDGDELAFARARWGMEGAPDREGGHLPIPGIELAELARQRGETVERLALLETRVREKLMVSRATRDHPRDGKRLAAWNGLMLSALIAGYTSLGDERYRVAASQLRDYLVRRLWTGRRLLRAREGNEALGSAALEDYVYVAAGLSDWGNLTGYHPDLQLAERLQEEAWRRFFREGGWRESDEDLIPGIALQPAIADAPLPSPVAMLIDAGLASANPLFKRRALEAVKIGYPRVIELPLWYATQVDVTIKAATTR